MLKYDQFNSCLHLAFLIKNIEDLEALEVLFSDLSTNFGNDLLLCPQFSQLFEDNETEIRNSVKARSDLDIIQVKKVGNLPLIEGEESNNNNSACLECSNLSESEFKILDSSSVASIDSFEYLDTSLGVGEGLDGSSPRIEAARVLLQCSSVSSSGD